MMSQMGSADAPERSGASPAASTSLGRQFMSVMLTYFGFMLQKHRHRRKDRTPRSCCRVRTGLTEVLPPSGLSYRELPDDAKCYSWRGKCAITAAEARCDRASGQARTQKVRVKEKSYGCAVLRPS